MGPAAVRLLIPLVIGLLMVACGAGPGQPDRARPAPSKSPDAVAGSQDRTDPSDPSPSDPSPSPRAPGNRPGNERDGSASSEGQDRFSNWTVGANPLPLRADGFGEVRPTPSELRNRRLPTTDRLPPPRDGRFRSSIQRIGDRVRERMGETWSPKCPVQLAELRYVRVSFHGFDGKPHTGELVVHRRVAEDIVVVFRTLHRSRFPIEEMRLVTTDDLHAHPTGDGNNTAAFVCRPARGQTRWSAHAYGLAIDINPFQNPYRSDDLVLPELASAYLNREWRRPGMIRSGDGVTRAFSEIDWTWGGTWTSPRDTMHFSATGN